MRCNIDRRGRWLRAVGGGACLLLAGAWWWTRRSSEPGAWIAWAVVLAALGAFQLFEAVKGWCVLRALGIRTPW